MKATLAAGSVVLAAAIGLAAGACTGPAASPDAAAATHAEPARTFWTAYNEATARRAKGDIAGAVLSYRRALQLRPDHEDSLYYLGNCHLDQGSYPAALEAYRRLVSVNPEGSSRGYMQSALVHASLEPGAPLDLDAAERLFARALDVDPDSGAVLGLAEVAVLRDDHDRAATWLARADVENPTSVAVPYLRGYLALRRGARPKAWRLFETAVKRGQATKAAVTWSEEGDVKADPALRWQALARQSVFGRHWLRLRRYLEPPGPTRADMAREYRRLEAALADLRGSGTMAAGSRSVWPDNTAWPRSRVRPSS
jgi:tetratricopeptide (TPR) repeat protein